MPPVRNEGKKPEVRKRLPPRACAAATSATRRRGRLLMFDLDGTLLDTRHDLATAVNLLRAEHGRAPLSVSTVTRFVGDGLGMLVRRSLPGPGLDLEEAAQRCAAHYRRHMTDRTRPYPGVAAGLRRLKQAGYRLALISNKPVAACRRLLRHFGIARLFDRIYGGDSTPRRKPHPEPLRAAMRALGARPDESWMIGDHRTDLETARRARVRSAWLSQGMGRRGKIRPDRTFERFSELTAFFLGPYAEHDGQGAHHEQADRRRFPAPRARDARRRGSRR